LTLIQEVFDKEFDAQTFSEQGFSIGKGSLKFEFIETQGENRGQLLMQP
jgi:hypothetical protein